MSIFTCIYQPQWYILCMHISYHPHYDPRINHTFPGTGKAMRRPVNTWADDPLGSVGLEYWATFVGWFLWDVAKNTWILYAMVWEPKIIELWKWMEDDFPFQLGLLGSCLFSGVYIYFSGVTLISWVQWLRGWHSLRFPIDSIVTFLFIWFHENKTHHSYDPIWKLDLWNPMDIYKNKPWENWELGLS